jgi:PiT family inorganic phosphate transporter
LFLKHATKSHALFHIPTGEDDRPPILIRLLLITTCTLVSFFHGSNDGQKGVGLFMLILIAFLPGRFAVNHHISNDKVLAAFNQAGLVITKNIDESNAWNSEFINLADLIDRAKESLAEKNETDVAKTYRYRKQVEAAVKAIRAVLKDNKIQLSENDRSRLIAALDELEHVTDFAPVWVIAIISISLGLGTMIGWKRIVVTIGEKIGNEHLSYAQGATSEIVAASTIGLSTAFGLPVSTTHVLSSGIAGAMVASGGKGNLNNKTIKNIAMAWVLTLPVAIILASLLFMFFHLFI